MGYVKSELFALKLLQLLEKFFVFDVLELV